ncbi:MAG: 5-oxoprolinase subunit PxpB [Vicinamibacterales bacterium]
MDVHLVSDTMLLVDFGQVIDPAVNARAIALGARLAAAAVPGVRDIVPAYCSVGVHIDPLLVDLVALEARIVAEAEAVLGEPVAPDRPPVEIPVHYGGEAGPDLELLAAHAGLSTAEVIERHAARLYRVYMLGFVPGFAYMGGVDPAIAAPRHRVPRERVPAGSVGIAGEQTGIYPIATPGGWQIIGRTDLAVFDPSRDPACLLAPGDRVRFVPVPGGAR